ncbi:MAG: ATP-binding cassette, subfamily C, bacterial [Parcubacteria group bacterium Gr01-1014_33]|nr:MAG: ATP-binding cassette, subfamily C, bacterial [Parcubacteria group bacterium Gr01-1014_33]
MHLSQLVKLFRFSKELYGDYKSDYKSKMLLLALFGFFNGLLGAIGVGALIPFFSFIIKKNIENPDIVSRFIEWLLTHLHLESNITSVLILIVSLFILKAIAVTISRYAGLRIVCGQEMKLRKDLYRAALSMTWPYLLRQKLGYLENTLTSDIGGAMRFLAVNMALLNGITSLLMYTAVAVSISWQVTLLALAGGGVILFLSRPFFLSMRRYGKEQATMNKEISHEINENATGLKVIKAMRVEKKALEEGGRFFEEFRRIRVRAGTLKTIVGTALQPLSALFISIFFIISYENPQFDLAAFLAVIYLIQQIFGFIDKVQDALHDMNNLFPYAKNVLAFKKTVADNREEDKGTKSFSLEREIQFKGVSFTYGAKPILAGVNFSIKKGEMFGVIGPSGAGKTTIADLILRLFIPEEGEILLDGVDARDISLDQWRKNIGYVSQEIFLKNSAIEENIKFYDDTISEEEMFEAARMANIYDVVSALPQGFATIVGERGVFLSAGQRQRIILARILARRPKILVLDEATSALDNESESMIQQAIENLKGEVTVIVIAHRLSTIMNCDRLLVLNDGQIQEEGKPRELLENQTSYFHKVHAMG